MMTLSALEIAEKIKSGELSSQDVVNRHIHRIEEVNPAINAVVEPCFERAMEEARKKDLALTNMTASEKSKLPLFYGVPFTAKEMISSEGMKSTLGSVHRKSQIMSKDATVVSRLKEAGAILIGTTNVPEVGFWFECDNLVYGRTNNPHDPKRTSGGSSGGEGAIIGSGGSVFGIGSDIGGSIRIPAAFCGIFGHKPSDRLVPFTGHVPVYHDNAKDLVGNYYPFTVLGPMARKAKDLYPLLQTMIGPDNYDQETKKDFKLKPLIKNPSDLKVYSLPRPVIHGTTETSDEIASAVTNATKYLEALGSETNNLPSKTFLRAFDLWTGRAWSMEGRNFPEYLSAGQKIDFRSEFSKVFFRKGNYTLPSLLTAFLDTYGSDRSQKEVFQLELKILKEKLTGLLGNDSVIILPVHPRVAVKHNATISRPFDFSYTGVFNALGFPATSVPMGLNADKIPLAVQVVAAENQDHLCLSVAEWLESGFGGSTLTL